MRVGNRQDFEKAIRLFFHIPLVFIGGPLGSGLLVPGFIGFVIGGVLGGIVAIGLSEGLIALLRWPWPIKTLVPKSSASSRKKKRRPQLQMLDEE